ncbi:hypothetical protein LAZ67_6000321 [Cordylochernes scorpioides]|uniref:Kazal-like domain-containing protein n=1 Tax=Cordylochernes scorpioides TaxID=51811 RepID=A0ABY6KIH8_9ARAC|nr:hypothetical protein LAZ67_6000321 [Cordylochernes scorpioides]
MLIIVMLQEGCPCGVMGRLPRQASPLSRALSQHLRPRVWGRLGPLPQPLHHAQAQLREDHQITAAQVLLRQSPRGCCGDVDGRAYDACPSSCQEVYQPVCGSDGRVYVNECFLRQEGCKSRGGQLRAVDMHNCAEPASPCPEVCVALYDPVCGSDGKLYLNLCRMLQENCG